MFLFFFFFNDTATTEIYTLSLHDALPILAAQGFLKVEALADSSGHQLPHIEYRSEEHTSELQSLRHLVCRLLLEKKKKNEVFVLHRSNRSQITTASTSLKCRLDIQNLMCY